MRNIKIAPGEHYHLYNRGNDHQIIFFDDTDRVRFLFTVLYFQSSLSITDVAYQVDHFRRLGKFNFYKKNYQSFSQFNKTELINFCLMPNHFHLTMFENKEGGISKYMQRVLNSYTKYFNTRYKKTGHLFSGPYQAVHVKNNTQLLHLSSYIHRNPREMREWRGKEDVYPWSSFQDYVKENRWDEMIHPKIILDQFNEKNEYKKFVETSTAKDISNSLDLDHLDLDRK